MAAGSVSLANIIRKNEDIFEEGDISIKPTNTILMRETELDVEDIGEGSFGGIDDGLLPSPKPPELPLQPGRPDINLYQQRKTLAQGMMDVALLTANANQLRIALERDTDTYYSTNIILISFSITIQILIGLCLIWNSSYNINKDTHLTKANRVNNITIIGIFVVTILNVFISAFGVSVDVTTGTSLAIQS